MKKTFLLLSLLFVVGLVFAQTPFTATYTFGSGGNVTSFAYNGTIYPGFTMNNIEKIGVTSSSSSGNFRATDWPLDNSPGPDAGKYIGFTITAAPGYKFTVNTIGFGIGRSGTGTRDTEWRGSADSYAALINNYTTTNSGLTNNNGVLNNPDANSNWTGNVLALGLDYADVTASCGFRIYMYTAEASGGTAGLQGPLTITGTYQATGATPSITVDPSTLSGFGYIEGSGSSGEQSFALTGSNLTANLVVSAPTNYEIAGTSGGTFGSSLSYTPSGGSVSTTVYVRMKAGLTAGSYNNEVITCTSSGATTQNVTCNGTVYKTEPTNHVTSFTCGSETSASITVTWTDAAKVTPDGYIIKGSDVGYSSIADPVDGVTEAWDTLIHTVAQGIQTYTFTGLAENTTYYFKIYPYTNSGTNINYKTDSTVPQDNGTTLENFNLAPGDIAVIGYESDSPDWFSIVLLVDIPGGTVVYFTDNGFNDIGALNTSEGTIAWTVPSSGLTAGSVVNFSGGTWSVDKGSISVSGDFNLATNGDQIIVYQGSSSSPSFIYAISTTSWVITDAITSNTTYLPTGLVDGETAFDFSTEYDNGYYKVISFEGTRDELLASIADETNWTLSNTALSAPTNWNFTINEPVNPVELASFTATISAQNYITLTWVTQTETGMRGYYIYRGTESDIAGAQNVSPLIPSLNSSQMQTYMFEDTEVYETGTYYYWLQTNDLDGTVNYHGPVSVFYNSLGDNPTPEIPLATKLHAVYPNPFNPLVFIPFSLAKDNDVSFKIYNSRGQIVKHFELGNKAPGNYRITWDGTDYNGNTLSNGVYQIVMTAGSQVYQTKTTLLK